MTDARTVASAALSDKRNVRRGDAIMGTVPVGTPEPQEQTKSKEVLTPEPELLRRLSRSLALEWMVLPLRQDGPQVLVAVARPLEAPILGNLSVRLQGAIRTMVVPEDELRNAIETAYEQILDMTESAQAVASGEGDSTAVRVVSSILAQSLRMRASDIHFEPRPDGLHVRVRVDGVLHEALVIPTRQQDSVLARVKILAGLDFASRKPMQDGQISVKVDGREVAYRVSVLRSYYGDNVVLRVLDTHRTLLTGEDLGLEPEQDVIYTDLMLRTSGMLVVSGPTGSGKTTTLYAALRGMDAVSRHIITLEDPVEYVFEQVTQVPVMGMTGLSFADALKATLRQDPDVIVVGETRDPETASIALNAAQTGHLVLTSFHATSAVGTVERLVEMGLEPYLLAASVNGVLAQRLLRKNCPHCLRERPPKPEEIAFFERQGQAVPSLVKEGGGCASCAGIGYRGRMAIFEILPFEAEIAQVLSVSGPAEFRRETKLLTLAQMGLRKVAHGDTTVSEVVRALGTV